MTQEEQNNAPSYNEEFYRDVITNATGLLHSFDYKDEIKFLALGTFDLRLKSNMLMEFKALYVALWNLALCHSFPNDHEEIYKRYIEIELKKEFKPYDFHIQVKRIEQYNDLMQGNLELDFSPIGHHILSFLDVKEAEHRNMTLKIALHVRSVYKYIFDRLF